MEETTKATMRMFGLLLMLVSVPEMGNNAEIGDRFKTTFNSVEIRQIGGVKRDGNQDKKSGGDDPIVPPNFPAPKVGGDEPIVPPTNLRVLKVGGDEPIVPPNLRVLKVGGDEPIVPPNFRSPRNDKNLV